MERVESYETRLRARDGSIKQVLIEGSGLFRDGRFVHGRLITRDLTRLMQREQGARHRAEATSHLKDEFLALLSHELRAPLGAILVWLGLLRQGGFDAAGRERALEIIERSARSLERIIEDLLHASRIAAGGLMLHTQLVDLRSVVQVAVDAAAGDAALKGLSLAWAPGETPLWVRGDPGRLQQAVSNLLSNAIKFTPAGGDVRVSLDGIDHQARLCVKDNGEGMSAAFLPFAFETLPATGQHQHPRPPRSRAGSLRGAPRRRTSRRLRERGEPRAGPGQHVHGAASAGGRPPRGAEPFRSSRTRSERRPPSGRPHGPARRRRAGHTRGPPTGPSAERDGRHDRGFRAGGVRARPSAATRHPAERHRHARRGRPDADPAGASAAAGRRRPHPGGLAVGLRRRRRPSRRAAGRLPGARREARGPGPAAGRHREDRPNEPGRPRVDSCRDVPRVDRRRRSRLPRGTERARQARGLRRAGRRRPEAGARARSPRIRPTSCWSTSTCRTAAGSPCWKTSSPGRPPRSS